MDRIKKLADLLHQCSEDIAPADLLRRIANRMPPEQKDRILEIVEETERELEENKKAMTQPN